MLVSDQVFRTLLEALLEGRYAPGEKLPTQRALAADLDVTMSSVREALKRLEQMGLVDVRQGDAMRVRDWRAHGGLDVVAHLVLRPGRWLGRSTRWATTSSPPCARQSRTRMASPWRTSTSPICSRRLSASRTELMVTSRSAASARWVGSFSPGA